MTGSASVQIKIQIEKGYQGRSVYVNGVQQAESNSGEYFFDLLNSVLHREEIIEAEFHFFTNRNPPIHHHHTSHLIQIHLYEGTADANFKLLQARMVSAHSSGWEVFKVTSSVNKWISKPDLNLGLAVKVLDSSGHEWKSHEVIQLQNNKKPILIVFSRDPKLTKSNTRDSVKLSTPQLTPDNTEGMINKTTNKQKRSVHLLERGFCMRHELRVDFEKLGWSTWIISPKWYDAYLCAGECSFPLSQNQRPTNHATVQSIVHELGLTEGVGAPCCVPTELHPVSLLYFDEFNNVVLKQYDDMVAQGCGCH